MNVQQSTSDELQLADVLEPWQPSGVLIPRLTTDAAYCTIIIIEKHIMSMRKV